MMSMTDQDNEAINGMRKSTEDTLAKVTDSAKKAYERSGAKEAVQQSKERLHTAMDATQMGVDRAQEYVTRQMHERPIASAATAMGIGLVVGLLIAGGRRG